MARGWKRRIALVVALLAIPAALGAQTEAGSIAGTARDATGAVLPGVTVEASSPALIERVRSVVTDGQGQYKIVELRPGTYSVTFSLPGFSTVRREGVELTTGFTATVNAEMKVGSVAETITVSGQAPLVDVQNTNKQVVMTRDIVDNVPTGKTFQNLGVLVPGVVGNGVVGSSVPQDVGGSSGQSYMALSIHGGRQGDQQIQVDGMPMINWTRSDASAILFPDGNFQEYAFQYSANSAEVEAGGVRVNLIPREGGNTFKGSVFANFSTSGLQAGNLSDALRAQGLTAANGVQSLWTVNPTLGGPLVTDKLWFFISNTENRVNNYVAGTYRNANPTAWTYTPDLARQAVDDLMAYDGALRLTWQASQKNKLTAFVEDQWYCHCHFLVGGATKPEAAIYFTSSNQIYQASWTSTITNKLLLEAAVSSAPQPEHWDFEPDALAPGVTDIGRGIAYRAAGIPNTHNMLTDLSARTSVSYVTGSHALKAGYTLLAGKYVTHIDKLGEETFTALNGVPVSVTYYGDPSVASYYVMPNLGIFAQDQWTLNRLTTNLGLRFDYFRSGFEDQVTPATLYVPVERSFPGQVAVAWKDLSPRLGVSYDLFGNGKTALKASVSRYVVQFATTFASTLNPITNNNTSTRALVGNPPIGGDNNPVITGNPLNPAANGNLGPATNALFGQPIQTVHYDPGWSAGYDKRPYDWEVATGVQHELWQGLSVNASYYRRIYGNFYVTQNQALTPASFNPYCVTTPADSRLPGGGSQQLCGLYDLNPAFVGRVQNQLTAAGHFGAVYEHWNGIDLTMSARMAKLLLQGGVSTGKTSFDDCSILTQYPNVVVPGVSGGLVSFASSANTSTSNTTTPGLSSQFCATSTPFLTQFKLLGSYSLPKDIQFAATLQSLPGPMIGAYGSYTSAQIAPSLGRPLGTAATATIDLVAPGTLYGERLNQLDLRVTKVVKVRGVRLQGMMDLYNALNGNPVLVVNNTYGATVGASAGSAWQLPQGILPGRIIKFGIQANF